MVVAVTRYIQDCVDCDWMDFAILSYKFRANKSLSGVMGVSLPSQDTELSM